MLATAKKVNPKWYPAMLEIPQANADRKPKNKITVMIAVRVFDIEYMDTSGMTRSTLGKSNLSNAKYGGPHGQRKISLLLCGVRSRRPDRSHVAANVRFAGIPGADYCGLPDSVSRNARSIGQRPTTRAFCCSKMPAVSTPARSPGVAFCFSFSRIWRNTSVTLLN